LRGVGGVGIVGAGLSIVNSGTVAGGTAPNFGQADAIEFTGGTNTLQLQAGSSITGNVVAFSTADTLALGGTTNATFDVSQIGPTAQYQGFGIYEKTGTSTWTLTGTTAAVTPWTINQGTLAVSADSNLGSASGGLTFGGGTLQFLSGFSSARAITLNAGGGTFDTDGNNATLFGVIGGSGGLTVQSSSAGGSLTLTGTNTYTGPTNVNAGTLALAGVGSIAASSGVTDNGTFDISGLTNGGASIVSLAGGGTVALGGNTLTLSNAAGSFSGVIADGGLGGGSGGKLVLDAGTETLAGADT
jgi:autotransporter-associated beta strand protein